MEPTAGDLLRLFREKAGISLREAARQLRVSHPALRNWEQGVVVPSEHYRRAIEVWTAGEVPALRWGRSAVEERLSVTLAEVRPLKKQN